MQLLGRRIADSIFVYREQLKVNPYEHSAAEMQDEANYTCDGCGEEIIIPIDFSQGASQRYVEDCPVCCRSNVIHVDFGEDGEATVWAEPEQDYD